MLNMLNKIKFNCEITWQKFFNTYQNLCPQLNLDIFILLLKKTPNNPLTESHLDCYRGGPRYIVAIVNYDHRK